MTGNIKQRLLRGCRQLLANQKGVAAVEFALLVPVLLLAFLGATDLTQGLAADRKLGQLASIVSEQVSREDTTVSRAGIQAIMRVGDTIMRPYDFGRTSLRATVVEVRNGTARVKCATHHNWSDEAANGATYALLSEDMARMAEGQRVVIATARYQFTPTIGYVIDSSLDLEQRSMFLMRETDVAFNCGGGSGGGGGGTGGGGTTTPPAPTPTPPAPPTPAPSEPSNPGGGSDNSGRPSYCGPWTFWLPACRR